MVSAQHPPPSKIDLARARQDLYAPPAEAPVLVGETEFPFLMLDGAGDPMTAPERLRTVLRQPVRAV